MIKPVPWANALASTAIALYLVLWLLSVIAPPLFSLIFNAQFLGANVSSLYSATMDARTVIVTLIVVAITTWVIGYVWALFYNYWSKRYK